MSNHHPHKNSTILLVILIAYVMMPIIGMSVNVALPAIGKSLSSNPVELGWISISLLLSIAVFAVTFLLSLYLQYAKGFSPQRAGLFLVSQPLFQAVLSPLAGRLVDRVKPHFLSLIGMASATSGMLLFAFITVHTHPLVILAGLFLVGAGWAFFISTNMNDAIGSVDKKYYGTTSGMIVTIRQIGMMSSIALAMLTFSLFMGRVQVTPEHLDLFLKSVKMAFGLLTVLCFSGLLSLGFRGKIKN